MLQWYFSYTVITVLLQCNHHSVAIQPPFYCNATTILLQYNGRSIEVKNKCYFIIVVKTIQSYQEKVRQNMRFSMKKQEKKGKMGIFQLQARR